MSGGKSRMKAGDVITVMNSALPSMLGYRVARPGGGSGGFRFLDSWHQSTFTVVPEPSSALVAGIATAGFMGLRKRPLKLVRI